MRSFNMLDEGSFYLLLMAHDCTDSFELWLFCNYVNDFELWALGRIRDAVEIRDKVQEQHYFRPADELFKGPSDV